MKIRRKKYLILISWLVVLLLILALWLVIGFVVSAFYHPNYPAAPYYEMASMLWLPALAICFIFALILTIWRKRLSVRQMQRGIMGTYGGLLLIAALALITVEPVPAYFTHMVGDVQYQVPREFTSRQNRRNGVNLDICLETLTGIYSRGRGDCDYERVYLSRNVAETIRPKLVIFFSSFFEEIPEFNLEGNKVILLASAEQYRVKSSDRYKSYTFDRNQEKSFKTTTNIYYNLVHLQINEQNELVRFVGCRYNQYSGNHYCQNWLRKSQGLLEYQSKGSADFNLELWQKTENSLLNLINQWKVD